MRNVRVTRKIRKVLEETPASGPDNLPMRGMLIGNKAGVGVSAVYPILDRLVNNGFVVATRDGLNQYLRYQRTERGDQLLRAVTR